MYVRVTRRCRSCSPESVDLVRCTCSIIDGAGIGKQNKPSDLNGVLWFVYLSCSRTVQYEYGSMAYVLLEEQEVSAIFDFESVFVLCFCVFFHHEWGDNWRTLNSKRPEALKISWLEQRLMLDQHLKRPNTFLARKSRMTRPTDRSE